jgi:ribosomal protein S18 acetylase RimI-like enzyme
MAIRTLPGAEYSVTFVRDTVAVTAESPTHAGGDGSPPGAAAAPEDGGAHGIRFEVLPPSDPRAERVLHAFMADLSTSYFGRPATDDEVLAGLRDFPSDDLQPPRGLLLVALGGDNVVGCAGLRFIDAQLGEVTRVYVAPHVRRRGLARGLMTQVERHARERGLRRLRLDTRADLVEARGLYERIGYREIPRFNDSRYADHWFEKPLG